jgi:hypothetical protein
MRCDPNRADHGPFDGIDLDTEDPSETVNLKLPGAIFAALEESLLRHEANKETRVGLQKKIYDII